jgi:hypothetical protein
VLYSVFGDESHDEANKRVFAVAGLFGSDDDWASLNDRWLKRMGGKVFHATECDTDKGSFAEIDHAENKKLYKDLVQILCSSKIMGFGTAIDLAGHQEFFPDAPPDIAYYRCFLRVIWRCGKWAACSIPQGPVKYTFDQRRESDYNAGVLYDYMANLPEWRASDPLFEEISFASRKIVGIQAADLFARETMKHLDNMIGPVERPMRRSMAALREAKRFGFDFYMREYFEDFRCKFESAAKDVGMDEEHLHAWLRKHKIADGVSARHRYLIELEAAEGVN